MRERLKGKVEQRKKVSRPHSSADAMKEGVGRNSGSSFPAPGSPPPGGPAPPPPPCAPLPAPILTPRPRVYLSRDQPSHIRSGEEVQYRLAAPAVGKEVPDLEPALPPPCLLPHFCPHDLLLGFPLGVRLEEVIPRLRWALAPPALESRAALRPLEILPREAVTCLHPEKPRGKPLGAPSNATYPPASRPLPCLHPLFLQDPSLELCEGPGKRHRACFHPVRVPQPLHPTGVWLLRCEFGPLVGLLVPCSSLMR